MKSQSLPSRFRRRPLVFAIAGLAAYVLLVAAFAIPAALMNRDDEPEDDLAAERAATYATELEAFHDLQADIALAQCEADNETAFAGWLALRTQDALEDTEALEIDSTLFAIPEKLAFMEGIEAAAEQAAALNITDQQRLLAEEIGDAPLACEALEPELEELQADNPPSEEQLAVLRERVGELSTDLTHVAAEGVTADEVSEIVEPLGPLAEAAAVARTTAEYYQNTLNAGSFETMTELVDTSAEVDTAFAGYQSSADAETSLDLVEALIALADASNRVVEEHNAGQEAPVDPQPEPPSPVDPEPTEPSPTTPPTTPPPTTPPPTEDPEPDPEPEPDSD